VRYLAVSTRAEGEQIARLIKLEWLPQEGRLLWKGSSALSGYALVGAIMAPPFGHSAFRLEPARRGDRRLVARGSQIPALIRA
jgi:predicted cupin superfamily sugar epimerase